MLPHLWYSICNNLTLDDTKPLTFWRYSVGWEMLCNYCTSCLIIWISLHMYVFIWWILSRDSVYSSALHLRIDLQKNRINNKHQLSTANIFLDRVPRRPHAAASPPRQPQVTTIQTGKTFWMPLAICDVFLLFYSVFTNFLDNDFNCD
jgi:hypothetical protein